MSVHSRKDQALLLVTNSQSSRRLLNPAMELVKLNDGDWSHHLGNRLPFLMHKEHVVEMVESIIKETDLDAYAEQRTEGLRASGFFDLSRVCSFPLYCSFIC